MAGKKTKQNNVSLLRQFSNDIYAVLLIAAGSILAVSVYSTTTGALGKYIDLGLKYSFGTGRYVFPLVLIVWGIGLAKKNSMSLSIPLLTGLMLVFLSFIAMYSLSIETNHFDKFVVSFYGGYAGSAVAFSLSKLLGKTASYILLAGFSVIGIVLATGKSLMEYGQIAGRVFEWLKFQVAPEPREQKSEKKKKVEVTHHRDNNVKEEATTVSLRIDEGAEEPADVPEDGPLLLGTASADYKLPPLNLLKESDSKNGLAANEVPGRIKALEKTLKAFDVDATVTKAIQGPTVTLYEIHLGSGVKVNKISNLEADIALALATPDIRILAPIPGKSAVGIEVPNSKRELVTLGDILISAKTPRFGPLGVGLGKDISGQPIFADIGSMPHLLIAGATGSGKSVAVNNLLISILMRDQPGDVRLLLIDPKIVELSVYNGIPHLLTPVISNPKKAAVALSWAVNEMEERYQHLYEAGAKSIAGYNSWIKKQDPKAKIMPYILIIIDELADLMMSSANEVESAICRIAQKARAVGIHLIVATQRPSVDVITGLIKANITTRIAFAVSTQHDSRVIVDSVGAEKLVGKGDMLYMSPSNLRPERIQGAYLSEQEVTAVTDFIKKQGKPDYNPEIIQNQKTLFENQEIQDSLWIDAADIIMAGGHASVSMLQRRLGIGYTRAGRLMDILEHKGMVGSYEGSKPRTVLISPETWEQMRKEEGDR
jgi:S-DNA-T family DNA segregation ATPase FtsK/SpoIIIE